jgi:hypothetical protein
MVLLTKYFFVFMQHKNYLFYVSEYSSVYFIRHVFNSSIGVRVHLYKSSIDIIKQDYYRVIQGDLKQFYYQL